MSSIGLPFANAFKLYVVPSSATNVLSIGKIAFGLRPIRASGQKPQITRGRCVDL